MVFTAIIYRTHSRALLDGLDQKLITAAYFTKAILPEGFHDNIIDENSVSKADYLKIVDSYNKLCDKLGLEYVWSLMLVDGKTVFTTGTSTSKDVTKGDHASFFEVHSNPELYTDVFDTMETYYQINDDKWGRIKVVLIPFKDKHGRPYLFGASMKLTEVDAMIRDTLIKTSAIGCMIIVIGVVFSFVVARRLSKPLEEVTAIAQQIASGNLNHEATVRGCSETESLSKSINLMNKSIKKQIDELQSYNQQLESSQQQLKASNQQLMANEKEREKLLKSLTAKNKELQSVVYVASHDLRSPLVNIEGFGGELTETCLQLKQLIDDSSIDHDLKQKLLKLFENNIPESLRFIRAGTAKMSSLLDGLLQVSRVGSAKVKIKPLDMARMINDIRRSMEFQISEADIELIVEDMPGCLGDGTMTNQVFSNLIGNALKYLNPDRKPKIHISGRIENGNSVYCVEDKGIGIDPAHQDKIFELFHRLNPEDTTEGEGLGLTIVTRILDRLNGSIRIE
ncbi:MAG: HAMP domain-containing protein, partial [Gammaproteobacteria bacterium]|nr:HAMP domain-containing protein [Gammaproteobacteria bacterium]